MNNLNEKNYNKIYDDEINLLELFLVFWKKKFFIIFITFLAGIVTIQHSLSLPNIYKSSVLLAPAGDEGSSSMLGRYGGMASLAGISLPSSSANKSIEAISRVNSFEFFNKFILPNILLQNLMAVDGWNPQSNELNYNNEVFNSISGEWVRKASFPKTAKPSPQEAYKSYRKIMSISQDNATSFVGISIKHQSPNIAKEWVQKIVKEINRSMREHEKDKVVKSIAFLNSQISKTNYNEVKKAISSLQQEQMKSLMLIEASEDYIFTVLNSPIAPELKSEPKRSTIVIFGTIIGFILSLVLVLIFHYIKAYLFKNSKDQT